MVSSLAGLKARLEAHEVGGQRRGSDEITTLGGGDEVALRLHQLRLGRSPEGLELIPKSEDIVDYLFGVCRLGGLSELSKKEAVNLTPFSHLHGGQLSDRSLNPVVRATARCAVQTESSTALLNEGHDAGYKRLGFHNLSH